MQWVCIEQMCENIFGSAGETTVHERAAVFPGIEVEIWYNDISRHK